MQPETKLRILMLNYEYPPLGGGAANQTFFTLAEFYNQPNIEIDLITASTGKFYVENPAENVRVFYLDIGKNNNLHYQSGFDLLTYSYKAFWFAKKLIRENNYTGVHAFFGIPCGFIAMLLGLPYLVSLCGSDVPFHNKKYFWVDVFLFNYLSRLIWRRAAFVIPNSEGLKNTALKTNKSQAFKIIPNGVDTTIFSPSNTKKATNSKLQLISVGRLSKIKQFNLLVEALEHLPNCELSLIGDGPELENLQKLAKEKNILCNFYGKLNRNEIVEHLQNSDIFVLPSENEGMSNALMEAMACGLPIIVSKVGGSQELVKNNGFAVENIDAEKIRKLLKFYLEKPEYLTKHGEESRKIALTMSWKQVSNAYFELYASFKKRLN